MDFYKQDTSGESFKKAFDLYLNAPSDGEQYHQIHNKTHISLGTISKTGKEVDTNKENNPGGHPSKLSTCDKQSII